MAQKRKHNMTFGKQADMTQSVAKFVFGKLNQTNSIFFIIAIATGVHTLVGVFAAALKRIWGLKGDLPNWRTQLWVANQGMPRQRASEKAGDSGAETT